jgi:hypothetical protein
MKKILVLIIGFLVFSCTGEEDLQTYTSNIRNTTTSNISVRGIRFPNDVVFDETINVNSSSSNCVISASTFRGLSCGIDSLVIRFDNNKGFICGFRNADSGEDFNQFCFSDNRTPLDGIYFNDLGNNTFEFVITQDDFDNANDLP